MCSSDLAPPVPLVGREQALTQLKAHIQTRPSTTPLVLYGRPGVGKSALALALAHDPAVQASFPNGILWAGLGIMPETSSHLARWGRLLGLNVSEHMNEGWVEMWMRLRLILAERSMLLIIDDVWRAEEAAMFLVGGPHCAHLVTTRLPLLVAQLTTEEGMLLEGLNIQDSMMLFS